MHELTAFGSQELISFQSGVSHVPLGTTKFYTDQGFFASKFSLQQVWIVNYFYMYNC